jgi:hypothetical protein
MLLRSSLRWLSLSALPPFLSCDCCSLLLQLQAHQLLPGLSNMNLLTLQSVNCKFPSLTSLVDSTASERKPMPPQKSHKAPMILHLPVISRLIAFSFCWPQSWKLHGVSQLLHTTSHISSLACPIWHKPDIFTLPANSHSGFKMQIRYALTQD